MNLKKNSSLFYTSVLLTLLIMGVFLQTRLANKLLSPLREYRLNSFIQQSEKDQRIDRKLFWEFRDRYSYGNFELADSNSSFLNTHLPKVHIADFRPQLFYSSLYIESLGGQTNLSGFPINQTVPENYLIYKSRSTRLYRESNGDYSLITISPLSQEGKVNGFINKISVDPNKKYWLEVSRIKH